MSVKDDIRINPNELDKQWADLPDQFHNYFEEQELLAIEIKGKELSFELWEARIDCDIRKDPKKYCGSEKITEKQIGSIIKSDPKWEEMQLEILGLEKQRRLIMAACKTLDKKESSLASIQKLYLSEFYIAPVTEAEKDSFNSRLEEIADRNVRNEMKKRIKRKERENE